MKSAITLLLFATAANAQIRFADDFEKGLGRWEALQPQYARLVDSGDPEHGHALQLESAGDQYVIIRESSAWKNVSIEGDVKFLTNDQNYLGIIYNFQRRGTRTDFGVIYIKGNESYLQANPHRDFNVSRLVYPEYHVDLRGDAAIRTGEWQHFKVEVFGGRADFFVGDMTTPQMTFPFFELESGAVGVQPRCCGGPMLVDNIRVNSIERMTYSGPSKPDSPYAAEKLLTTWEVAGPFTGANDDVARESSKGKWRPFPTDARGAVVTARVVDYAGPNSAAYFRTFVASDSERDATLILSTADDVAVWLNGRFNAFAAHTAAAWYDLSHDPRKMALHLRGGRNEIIIRIRGGISATGGYFARVE